MDRRVDGPQNHSGYGGEEKKIPVPCRESNPSRPADNYEKDSSTPFS